MPGAKEVLPPKDASFEYKGTLKFSGPMLRYSYDEPLWDAITGGFFRYQQVKTFDGTLGATLRPNPAGSSFPYQGHLTENANEIERLHVLNPLFYFLRPSNNATNMLREHKVTRWEQASDGSNCLVLRRANNSDSVRRMLLDPEHGYATRRVESLNHDKLLYELDIEYFITEGKSSLRSWSLKNYFHDGGLRDSFHVAVRSQEYNSAIPEHEFQINYPPSTLVFQSKHGNSGGSQFLVLENGSHRPVSDAELRVAKKDAKALAATQPPETALTNSRTSRKWVWLLVSVVVVAGVAIRAARASRRAAY